MTDDSRLGAPASRRPHEASPDRGDGPVIFLSAGEVSGDVHGANLVRALRELAPNARFVGWGSHRMAAAGVEVVEDLIPYAAVGLTENLAALRPAAKAIKSGREFLERSRPDVVVLIDYQGANMVLAKHARELKIPSVYFISPQEWIWGFKSGPAKVARQVDEIVCIFEREAEVYRQAGGKVRYVGHPLLDQTPDAGRVQLVRDRLGISTATVPEATDPPILGLFPGSRRTEIERLLPLMVGAARLLKARFPDLRIALPLASDHFRHLLDGALTRGSDPGITLIDDLPGIDVMAACSAAIAASGTVTLEAAIVGTPVVATYRVSALTAFLARNLFRIGHVSLPNIVAGHEVIPELLQENANPAAMADAIAPLLLGGERRDQALAGLQEVRHLLGEAGATRRAAECILQVAARG